MLVRFLCALPRNWLEHPGSIPCVVEEHLAGLRGIARAFGVSENNEELWARHRE